MKIITVVLVVAGLAFGVPAVTSAQSTCTTIQDGTLLRSDGALIETGFDE